MGATRDPLPVVIHDWTRELSIDRDRSVRASPAWPFALGGCSKSHARCERTTELRAPAAPGRGRRSRALRRKPKIDGASSPTTERRHLPREPRRTDRGADAADAKDDARARGERPASQRAPPRRGRFRGDLDEIQLGIERTQHVRPARPRQRDLPPDARRARAEPPSLRAGARGSRAREALGADPRGRRTSRWTSTGTTAATTRRSRRSGKARRKRPSTATWIREAQLDHDLGLEDEADAAFEAAEDLIADTGAARRRAPRVQRGIQKVRRGHRGGVSCSFARPSRRMPTYVAANEHLAETLHLLGKNDEAIAIYEKVVEAIGRSRSSAHALAELYAAQRQSRTKSRELETRRAPATRRCCRSTPRRCTGTRRSSILATGDATQCARATARRTSCSGRTARATSPSRAPSWRTGRCTDARGSIDKALAMPVVSASLFWTASAIYGHSGDASKAKSGPARPRARAQSSRGRTTVAFADSCRDRNPMASCGCRAHAFTQNAALVYGTFRAMELRAPDAPLAPRMLSRFRLSTRGEAERRMTCKSGFGRSFEVSSRCLRLGSSTATYAPTRLGLFPAAGIPMFEKTRWYSSRLQCETRPLGPHGSARFRPSDGGW